MTRCCIVLITDQTYLLPTLLSAVQARAQSSADLATVAIFHMGLDGRSERDFARACAVENVEFRAVAAATVEGANPMLARLFMNRFVPDQFDQYLYLDGDVQVVGSLDPLIAAEVPEGQFLAANDPMAFMLQDARTVTGPASHMAALGLQPAQARLYFNTGVLRINRNGWEQTGHEAWRLAERGTKVFAFPDQDPLNIVGASIHKPMSLAWNFPIFMLNARVESTIRPRIYHFMSKPKPWQGTFMPWSRSAYACYHRLIERHPPLRYYQARKPARWRVRYQLQQAWKACWEGVTWGYGPRRDRILAYETSVALGPR